MNALTVLGLASAAVMMFSPINGAEAQAQQRCGPALRSKMPETSIVQSTQADLGTHEVRMTQARLDAIVLAAEAYCQLSGGRFPIGFAEMMQPTNSIADGTRECRLDRNALLDAWGRPIFFAVTANGVLAVSAGPDGVFTTADDISRPVAGEKHVESFDWRAECASRK